MKNIVALAITTALLTLGSAFAQQDSHGVNVKIPNVLQLRITDGTGNNASGNAAIEFDYQTNPTNVDTYLTTVNNPGGGDLTPTAVTGFSDVIVFANRGTWSVAVSATALGFTDNLGLGSVSGAGVALTDIKVAPTGTAGTGVSNVNASWDMSGGQIANGVKTQGWSSLGFTGTDYALSVNGDEDPGEYVTVVTYTITAP